MKFGTLGKYLAAVFADKFTADDLHLGTGTPGKFALAEFIKFLHAAQKTVTGKNTGGGDGDIAFSFGLLIENDVPAAAHKGVADKVFTAEFI